MKATTKIRKHPLGSHFGRTLWKWCYSNDVIQIQMLIFESRIVFKCSNYVQMFEFIFECWRNVFLVHALEKWRLQMMWKNIWKRKEICILLLSSFLNPKICFLLGKGVEGAGRAGGGLVFECLCWARAWRSTRGFSWTDVTKRDGGR